MRKVEERLLGIQGREAGSYLMTPELQFGREDEKDVELDGGDDHTAV